MVEDVSRLLTVFNSAELVYQRVLCLFVVELQGNWLENGTGRFENGEKGYAQALKGVMAHNGEN